MRGWVLGFDCLMIFGHGWRMGLGFHCLLVGLGEIEDRIKEGKAEVMRGIILCSVVFPSRISSIYIPLAILGIKVGKHGTHKRSNRAILF